LSLFVFLLFRTKRLSSLLQQYRAEEGTHRWARIRLHFIIYNVWLPCWLLIRFLFSVFPFFPISNENVCKNICMRNSISLYGFIASNFSCRPLWQNRFDYAFICFPKFHCFEEKILHKKKTINPIRLTLFEFSFQMFCCCLYLYCCCFLIVYLIGKLWEKILEHKSGLHGFVKWPWTVWTTFYLFAAVLIVSSTISCSTSNRIRWQTSFIPNSQWPGIQITY